MTRADECYIEIQLCMHSRRIQCRSIYLRPEVSKKLLDDDCEVFEHIGPDCIVGADVTW